MCNQSLSVCVSILTYFDCVMYFFLFSFLSSATNFHQVSNESNNSQVTNSLVSMLSHRRPTSFNQMVQVTGLYQQ